MIAEIPAIAELSVEIRGEVAQSIPLIIALPHSGRLYPPEFLNQSRLDLESLRSLEDFEVDLLFADAHRHGAVVLVALYARAWLDVNRRLSEIDPRMLSGEFNPTDCEPTALVRNGIGLIPRLVQGTSPIYRSKIPWHEIERRIALAYHPYHHSLARLIEATREKFGRCFVLDAHSMPNLHQGRAIADDLILGDCHGRSCSAEWVAVVAAELCKRGYRVGFNQPYAGGYTTQNYRNLGAGVEVLQLEINRRLYMDESRLERLANFGRLQSDLDSAIGSLSENFLIPSCDFGVNRGL
ncbi:MAG: N-formylglutamate amidohydrolase [Alphaproteobacteria bacterium]|nr:N-formylglutamate amidohydrolase [Alphaproteobacteria bacterium]